MENFFKLRCRVYSCGDLEDETVYTFNNKISCTGKGNFCIPLNPSKYNDGSFVNLAFTELNISQSGKEKHLTQIQNFDENTAKRYFENYEHFFFEEKEAEVFFFVSKDDFKNSKISSKNSCIIENYEFPEKGIFAKEINLDYGNCGGVKGTVNSFKKITCDKTFNLLQVHLKETTEEIYIEGDNEDLRKEIESLKEKICNLGIEKNIVDKFSKDFEIDCQKIKSEFYFQEIKKQLVKKNVSKNNKLHYFLL